MYVCICKAVTERHVREAAASGESFAELRQRTGCGKCCGTCTGFAREVFRAVRAGAEPTRAALGAAA